MYCQGACTLNYQIDVHVRLLFWEEKSSLYNFIRDCTVWNFQEIFHPVRLLDTKIKLNVHAWSAKMEENIKQFLGLCLIFLATLLNFWASNWHKTKI